MCIPRISQTAVFPFIKNQSFQVTAWLSVFVQDRIRSKLPLVSWNDCAHVALCSVHKAQGWFLFCPCKLFDYGKIKCYGNCFFTDLICWFYSRLIHKPSYWKYIGVGFLDSSVCNILFYLKNGTKLKAFILFCCLNFFIPCSLSFASYGMLLSIFLFGSLRYS